MTQEIRDLLEKARGWILVEGGVVCPHKFGICKHDNENCPVFCIDQALKLLPQSKAQPSTEFIKECHYFLGKRPITARAIIENHLTEACRRLSASEASRRELLEACKETQKLFAFIAENYKSAPHFPNAERLVDAAITNAKKGLNL